MKGEELKVLIATPYYLPATRLGGPVFAVSKLAVALRTAGCLVRVLSTTGGLNPGARVPLGVWSDVLGVPTWYEAVGAGLPPAFYYSPGFAERAAQLIRQSDIVLIQGAFTYPTTVAARLCAKLGVKYVITAHGLLCRWARRQKWWKKLPYWLLWQGRDFRNAAAIHYSSNGEMAEAADLNLWAQAVVIPHSVVLEPFEKSAVEGWRERLRVQSGERLVVFCGRIHPVKGLDRLLQAVAILDRTGGRVRLAVAGALDSPYADHCQRLCARLAISERVEFLGHVEGGAKSALLAAADLFCLPSIQENFGVAAAEAMLAGTLVALGRGVHLAEDVRRADCGVVCETDPESIARAIWKSLDEPPDMIRQRCQRARKWAEERFSPVRVGMEMSAAIREILDRAAGPAAAISPGWRQICREAMVLGCPAGLISRSRH